MKGKRSSPDTGAASAAHIRVVIADDHPLIRSGLQSALSAEPDMLLIGEATNGEETQHLCQKHGPDVLLLDLRMPGPSALETVTYLHTHCPTTRVLMLTAYDDEAHVRGLVEAGVSGYLLKEEAPATVVQAIRSIMNGSKWFSQSVAEKLAGLTESPDLTRRELEVLQLVTVGKTNFQIAKELNIAEVTVLFHLRSIYSKINVHTRTEAVRWAMQHGLGEDPVATDR